MKIKNSQQNFTPRKNSSVTRVQKKQRRIMKREKRRNRKFEKMFKQSKMHARTSTPLQNKTMVLKNKAMHRLNCLMKESQIIEEEEDDDCIIIDVTKNAFNINESGILVLDEDISIISATPCDTKVFIKDKNFKSSTLVKINLGEKNINEKTNQGTDLQEETLEEGEIRDDDESIIICVESEGPKMNDKKIHQISTWDTELIDDLLKNILQKYEKNESHATSYTYIPHKIKEVSGKRIVIIDGSNVAFGHSNGKYFSVEGLSICLKFFERKGHEVQAVVPQLRFQYNMTNNQRLLENLKEQGKIVVTPSKNLPGSISCSYDDRFILQVASEFNGVIVSNDNYRDLLYNSEWAAIIKTRVIGYTWFKDMLLIPEDPYGKSGPSLQKILNK